MDDLPHKDDAMVSKLFLAGDAKIAEAMSAKRSAEALSADTYSYGGKDIAITCIGCEAAIAKAESARKRLESFAEKNTDPIVKEGLEKLMEIAKRDEDQARERSLMHHHFPKSLVEYDALIK